MTTWLRGAAFLGTTGALLMLAAAGGCGFGRLARSAMVGQRANMRIDLAGKLEPLYARKVSLNAMILAADLARMRLEAYAKEATTLD